MSNPHHALRHRWHTLTSESERGGGRAALETAILAPVLILVFIILVIAGGRISSAGSAVEEAARAAAREASLQRDGATAQSRATRIAEQSLAGQGLVCDSLQVVVDTSQFSRPLGQPAQVTATITCQVRLSDLGLPGAPGSKTMTSTFVSVIDPYRERGQA
ncbi:TadE/TadG family type IV pilus assembly protein [Kutzneria buriramensis]|uniref:TadE-like protein n=1 Tax=Kutzneria buriramensis TaxID=1045776 RepID=A0A3E0GW07_9PSEU|nr:TadE/TadG family type IV pilus assembly protein [Kutzneria buriramensis]REH31048.1 TadE-like protein [Kutzneria buriramensis]